MFNDLTDEAKTWFIGDGAGFEERGRDGEGKYVVHLTFDDPQIAKACLMRLMKKEPATPEEPADAE